MVCAVERMQFGGGHLKVAVTVEDRHCFCGAAVCGGGAVVGGVVVGGVVCGLMR